MCRYCQANPVYELTNKRKFCKKCFCSYVERKVFRTIRQYNLINNKDRVGVACSGGKDSNVALYILNKLSNQRIKGIIALALDEGIKGYRSKLIRDLKKFCKEQKIQLKIFSFKKEYGFTMSDNRIQKKIKKLKVTNCYVCSILKRWLLNKKARELGITRIATGHSLDDEAETILLNQIKGNPVLLAKLGPLTGIVKEKKFIRRIKPLYFIPTKEIILYAKIKKIPASLKACPLRASTLRVKIRNFLHEMEKQHPEIKNAIVRSFIQIMPLLKQKYSREKNASINYCKICKEPSSEEICKRCQLVKALKS